MPSVVSSATGKRIQVLLSIQDTAFDLGSAGTVSIQTVRWLRPATDVFQLTVHWAAVQMRPVHTEVILAFSAVFCVVEAVHKFVIHEMPKQEATTGM